jgi:mRNA interferase MazF
VRLVRGTVVLVALDPTLGHEQRGVRPCIAVSDPAVNADQRFPLIAVVPVTGTPGDGVLYPSLAPGPSGLIKTSYVLTDHVRSIDKRRIRRTYGQVSAAELATVDQGLELFLGLTQTQ